MDIGRIAPTHGMFPAALNDRGDVVGWAAVDYGFGDARAFGFIGGVLRDLTSLLPANTGWSLLLLALDINNRGEIVGVGLKDGLAAAFRMTPVEGGRLRP
jgi:hypothetical protein